MKNRTMAIKHKKARSMRAKEGNWRATVEVALDYQYGRKPKYTEKYKTTRSTSTPSVPNYERLFAHYQAELAKI